MPPLKPAPLTPDATRPLNELSLHQTLLTDAVADLEFKVIEARRRPLKPATPNRLPNIAMITTPVVAVFLELVAEITFLP